MKPGRECSGQEKGETQEVEKGEDRRTDKERERQRERTDVD